MVEFFSKGLNYIMGNWLRKKNVMLSGTMAYVSRNRELDANYFDQVRLASLELAVFEINQKKLKGNIAELGVYKGKFAKHLNHFFPDRKLYLFDTFEGFDQRDVGRERSDNFSAGTQDFSNTSVEDVLARMPYPANCIPVKGFFPDSAKGLEDEFVFVSLDADLYEPIYHGLQYFWPRLERGGYIFIHDFNNEGYKGARRAVEQFCNETGIGYTAIPDVCGSAIIAK